MYDPLSTDVAPQVGLEPTTTRLTAECSAIELLRNRECEEFLLRNLLGSGGDLLFRAVASQVPSALKGLTSVFGMGTGDPLRHCRRKSLRKRSAPPDSRTQSERAGPLPSLVSQNQALGLLVPASSTHCCASTAGLSPGRLPGALLHLVNGNLLLEAGFTLRCLQRLSFPYFASLPCAWRRNSCTSGTSIPVLSY